MLTFFPFSKKANWADEFDEDVQHSLPERTVTENPDGTKTIVTYKRNEQGKTVRITQKIKLVTAQEKVNPHVAERKSWAKYGMEKGSPQGPSQKTTSLSEAIPFKLGLKAVKHEEKEPVKEAVGGGSLKCRICKGDHFTSKCPMKDLVAPENGPAPGATAAAAGASATGGSSYVLPHLRGKGGAAGAPGAAGARPGFGERDDSTTLRVSNLNEDVIEEDLRDLFGRYGTITRCNIVKDRETGRSRGFGFVSFLDIHSAELAKEKLNRTGLDNLIIFVEFSGKRENR